MVRFGCPVPGCEFTSHSEKGVYGHLGQAHKGFKGDRKAVVLDDEEELTGIGLKEADSGFLEDTKEIPTPMNKLRAILTNLGVPAGKRETIVSLFRDYDSENYKELAQILHESGVTADRIKIILRGWKQYMGADYTDENEEKDEKTLKSIAGDPTNMTPEMLMSMTPGQIAKWKMDLERYSRANEMLNDAFSGIFGSTGKGRLDADTEAKLQKLDDMLEDEKERKRMGPIYKILDELKEERKGKKGSEIDDVKEMFMMMKMFEGMGSDKLAENARLKMEERLESMRITGESKQAELRKDTEQMRSDNQTLQIENIKTALGAQIGQLQHDLNVVGSSTPRGELLNQINEVKELSEVLNELQGGRSVEQQKLEQVGSIIDNATKTLAPVFDKLATGYAQKGNPQQRGVPQQPQAAGASPNAFDLTCQNCGNVFKVEGEPSSITCPKCGQVHNRAGAGEATAQPQASGEALWAQRKQELLIQPRDTLNRAAEGMGINPSYYPNKEVLVEEMIRFAKEMTGPEKGV